MDVAESSGWGAEIANAGLGVTRYFTCLAGDTRPGLVLGIYVDVDVAESSGWGVETADAGLGVPRYFT